MNTRLAVPVAALLLLVGESQGWAQEHRVTLGDRVRVMAPAVYTYPTEGKLRALQDGSLVVRDARGADHTIPVSAVTSLEIGAGGGSKAGRGALIGGLVGLAIGIAMAASADPCAEICIDTGGIIAAAGGLGFLGGAGLGAIAGSTVKEEVTWQPVGIDQLRVGWLPETNRGFAVLVGVSF